MYEEKDILTSADLVQEFPKTFKTQNTVAYMVRRKGLPHRRLSERKLQFSRVAIRAWLATKEIGATKSKAASKIIF